MCTILHILGCPKECRRARPRHCWGDGGEVDEEVQDYARVLAVAAAPSS